MYENNAEQVLDRKGHFMRISQAETRFDYRKKNTFLGSKHLQSEKRKRTTEIIYNLTKSEVESDVIQSLG